MGEATAAAAVAALGGEVHISGVSPAVERLVDLLGTDLRGTFGQRSQASALLVDARRDVPRP